MDVSLQWKHFSDYKAKAIDLLRRVVAVSLRTQEIVNAIRDFHQAANDSRH